MLIPISCVLLAASALAADYPYPGPMSTRPPLPSYPTEDGRVKPGTNLIFNFEQLRRDQPPQVEMRDEDIGQYMYRPRPKVQASTPKVPTALYNNYAINLPDSQKIEAEARYPDRDRYVTSTPMPPPPPPPAPKWLDLKSDFYNDYQHPTYYPVDTYQSIPTTTSSTTPIPEPIDQYEPIESFNRYPNQPYRADVAQYSDYQPPKQQPHWTEIAGLTAASSTIDSVVANPSAGYKSRGAGRGNHKFSWSDIGASPTEPAYLAPTTPPASKKNGPPPVIPTLTPWSGDNFGK